MKKTYVTTMPDHIGAFLKASQCFAELGINITRVSYNKAVDSHTLFLDAEGTPEQLAEADRQLTQIGFIDFGELHFEVYEGKGGHLPGEIVLIDYLHHIAFTGDVYINIQGLTPKQSEYNQYAPILMTSVDTDPRLCALERKAVLQRLGAGKWQIFGAHGSKKEYAVNAE